MTPDLEARIADRRNTRLNSTRLSGAEWDAAWETSRLLEDAAIRVHPTIATCDMNTIPMPARRLWDAAQAIRHALNSTE